MVNWDIMDGEKRLEHLNVWHICTSYAIFACLIACSLILFVPFFVVVLFFFLLLLSEFCGKLHPKKSLKQISKQNFVTSMFREKKFPFQVCGLRMIPKMCHGNIWIELNVDIATLSLTHSLSFTRPFVRSLVRLLLIPPVHEHFVNAGWNDLAQTLFGCWCWSISFALVFLSEINRIASFPKRNHFDLGFSIYTKL